MKMFKIVSVLLLAFMFNSAVLCAAETAPAPAQSENSAPGFWSKAGRFALIYLPNLFGDLFDIVTVEASFGNTAALDVHLTYLADFGLERSDAYFAGYYPNRRYGAGRREADRAALLCWSYEDMYVSQTAGNKPAFAMSDCSFNLVRCYTNAYADKDIDMWAIGVRAAMFVGLAVDLHLIEVPDFLCQIFGYDLADDNWK